MFLDEEEKTVIVNTIQSIAIEPHVETEVRFARFHRDHAADRAGRRDRAIGRYRRAGLRAVLQFRRMVTAAVATTRWQWLVRRGHIRAVSTANTPKASCAQADT